LIAVLADEYLVKKHADAVALTPVTPQPIAD
jgi:hypothetical protein